MGIKTLLMRSAEREIHRGDAEARSTDQLTEGNEASEEEDVEQEDAERAEGNLKFEISDFKRNTNQAGRWRQARSRHTGTGACPAKIERKL